MNGVEEEKKKTNQTTTPIQTTKSTIKPTQENKTTTPDGVGGKKKVELGREVGKGKGHWVDGVEKRSRVGNRSRRKVEYPRDEQSR